MNFELLKCNFLNGCVCVFFRFVLPNALANFMNANWMLVSTFKRSNLAVEETYTANHVRNNIARFFCRERLCRCCCCHCGQQWQRPSWWLDDKICCCVFLCVFLVCFCSEIIVEKKTKTKWQKEKQEFTLRSANIFDNFFLFLTCSSFFEMLIEKQNCIEFSLHEMWKIIYRRSHNQQ